MLSSGTEPDKSISDILALARSFRVGDKHSNEMEAVSTQTVEAVQYISQTSLGGMTNCHIITSVWGLMSKALTDTNRWYSQIALEALAVLWVWDRFDMYLWHSPHFTVISNHNAYIRRRSYNPTNQCSKLLPIRMSETAIFEVWMATMKRCQFSRLAFILTSLIFCQCVDHQLSSRTAKFE